MFLSIRIGRADELGNEKKFCARTDALFLPRISHRCRDISVVVEITLSTSTTARRDLPCNVVHPSFRSPRVLCLIAACPNRQTKIKTTTTADGRCKQILWRQGGPRRFYRGVLPSLASAPLCRFGDTLSNELAMVWFHGQQQRSSSGGGNGTRISGGRVDRVDTKLPVWVATFLGSMGAAAFHAVVVPLDTYKVCEAWRNR